MSNAPRQYFAARSRTDIGKSLVDRLSVCNADNKHDNFDQYSNAYRHYYGRDNGYGITTGITRDGAQGELAAIRVNRARAYAKALLALVIGPKINWRPQAKNSDSSAAAATKLTTNILENLWKSGGLSDVFARWVEQAICFSNAYVFPEWDRGIGPPLAVVNAKLVRQGDFRWHNVLPWDVRLDNTRKSHDDLDWKFVRLYKNRFDLAALNNRLMDGRTRDDARDAILTVKGDTRSPEMDASEREKSDDIIPVWYFFHKPTAALPAGRETVFIDSDVVLSDSVLTYYEGESPCDPVVRLAADEMFDTPHGWSQFWDTLGAQELLDGIDTTLATIITTLGGTNISIEDGTESKPDVLANNTRVWHRARGTSKPEAIQLAEFPPEALKYKEMIASDQRQLMGLNDVALGQPQSAQMNAQAFAVLASMAVQQSSPFQQKGTTAVGRLGTIAISTYARRVSRERMVKITGKSSAHLYSEAGWTGKDLRPVSGVLVDIGAPLEQTAQGRAGLLQLMMQVPGAIKSPQEITEVITTGRLEPAIRSVSDELSLVSFEYEQLSEGINPPVHYTHNHALHYRENSSPLFNPEGLSNPAVIQATEAHLDAHYLALYGIPRQQDPQAHLRESILLGREPDPTLMPPPPGMGPPMGAGGPPMGASGPPGQAGPPGAPPPGGPSGPEGMPPEAGPGEISAPPAPPINPMNGQPFQNGSPPIQ